MAPDGKHARRSGTATWKMFMIVIIIVVCVLTRSDF